jgi:hypothetical protein
MKNGSHHHAAADKQRRAPAISAAVRTEARRPVRLPRRLPVAAQRIEQVGAPADSIGASDNATQYQVRQGRPPTTVASMVIRLSSGTRRAGFARQQPRR